MGPRLKGEVLRTALIAIFVGVFVSGRDTASAVDLTACGQTVPAGDIGTLQADLDCSPSPGICFFYLADQPETDVACTSDAECQDPMGGRCTHVAITLQGGATLDLNGHSLTGAGVLCENHAPCAIRGGEIVAAQGFGIYGRGALSVRDAAVHDGSYIGIMSLRSMMRLENVDASHNFAFGIDAVDGNIIVDNVTANDNLFNNGVNSGRTVRGTGLTTNGNNPAGVTAMRIALRGLTANGNTEYGIIAGKIRLRDSTLVDNGEPGSDDAFDIYLSDVVPGRPTVRLINTTCGHSTAGVCAND